MLCDAGICVDNLSREPLLPWAVFSETVVLLEKSNGKALKGNAMSSKLGDSNLPLNSVEGHIADKLYGKKTSDSVFRRITPIAAILVWADICRAEPSYLVLNNQSSSDQPCEVET
jgi:hypothetical protein